MMREIKSRFRIEDGDDYGGRKEGWLMMNQMERNMEARSDE